jgi:DNA-binding CsgD family transcriptional regulator
MAKTQSKQPNGEPIVSDAAPSSVFVMLCDWRGRVTWANSVSEYTAIGDFAWTNLDDVSQQATKSMFSRVVTLRETQSIEVTNRQGVCFRCWLWPLDSPDVAVCSLITRIPAELSRLTKRERECLELLAHGTETREIARQLDISLSTTHTHLKRSREKLGLPNVEALISFAARYCYPPDDPLARVQP